MLIEIIYGLKLGSIRGLNLYNRDKGLIGSIVIHHEGGLRDQLDGLKSLGK